MSPLRTALTAAAALGLLLPLAFATAPANAAEEIVFPKDYKTFENYLSIDRTQDPDQIIRLFANGKALDAVRSGKELPDGSVIVGEVYKAKVDKDGKAILSTLGRRIRDKLALIAVMEKRPGFGKDLPTELQNNGWDFAAFKPDGTVAAGKDLNACRACHAPLTETQHLFSLQHIK